MESFPKFLNGVFPFKGGGLAHPAMLDGSLVYTVPSDRRAQLVYLRAGNSSPELMTIFLMRDGKPMRLFAIGAKAGAHVALSVVEDLEPETRIEVYVSAPEGVSGEAVVDIGILEILT
jgi:hypothetical protein